jgi:hypothetical protein
MDEQLMNQLYQLYYKDEHKTKLFPFSIPVKTEGLTIFFENYWIAELVKASNSEKIGITSWKLRDKLRRNVGLAKTLTEKDINGDYQVLSLTRNSKKHQMLAHLYQWHPSSKPAMALLWQKLGYKLPGEAKNPIYQNAFCGKTEVYKSYVANFLSPAMDLINTDEQLHELMIAPSGYGRLSREADVKSVKEKLNMLDYPLCPFVLERCPSLWFDMNKIPITYL